MGTDISFFLCTWYVRTGNKTGVLQMHYWTYIHVILDNSLKDSQEMKDTSRCFKSSWLPVTVTEPHPKEMDNWLHSMLNMCTSCIPRLLNIHSWSPWGWTKWRTRWILDGSLTDPASLQGFHSFIKYSIEFSGDMPYTWEWDKYLFRRGIAKCLPSGQVLWRWGVLHLVITFFSLTLRFWNHIVTWRSDRLVAVEILRLFSLVMNLLAAYSFSSSFSWIFV